ncbi:TonB-dependent receptor [Sinorhizobium meliloti]|uniref:FecR domain-containing protein n=1 Tax=Rhizobium meliloti TaxID=382 RepID=UPI000FD2E85E|nr:FecR domain-containing protein [Sinorhizobium meliloti]MDE4551921.1 FecR domain-containing protein [Sinorhizobium meliloti]RVG99083.1 TonB-dependent receptor [Sinorhizobium meliloti]RVH68185.1 TonB-dependent receptor [Sinorhizobium meliloti]RVN88831.1 TonB-dependent receptor [Sinorhizobium meliloti]RVO64887.1 TonB-dependent receptor [Sinorhizobium meliloti]
MRGRRTGALLAAVTLFAPLGALAEPVPRPSPAAGSVIARKSGEEVRFVDVSNWRVVDLAQDLLPGDVLRTNATGALAVLFRDHTQIRLGRNTALRVKQIGAGDTNLELESGTIWARAERGGEGLVIDTPAAAAAIRGTDWTLTVGTDGKTSLVVLEGVVELSNAYGSVTVKQGEGAVAAIGSAPAKIVIVTPKDREQMLFHLSLRNAFVWMPATPFSVPEMRRERARIEASPAASRPAEEWLTLAEIYLSLDGRDKAQAALAEAASRGLTRSQAARADLVKALIAGSSNRYEEAARLFARAERGLDPSRRTIAAYGGYFARGLADPARVEEPPRNASGRYAGMARAWTAGFREDIPAAIAVIKKAEQQYPDDPTLPAARAQLALLLDDRDELRDGVERALSIDPEDPTALEARAHYRYHIDNDLKGALADLERALKTAPGSSSIWNSLGLVQGARGDNRAAEAAFKQAIALDPLDPVAHANLAIQYMDEMRMAEAKREIDAALSVDPSFDVALVARGRYHMQNGEADKAVEDLLAGSTANPAYSNAQLLLAAAHYEKGDRIPAGQALDNADRLDPNDPVVATVRTAIAIDAYDADAAIRNAQEALRRTRAKGGDTAALGANQEQGSTLNDAFRLQGLDAWGQYYGDAVFDPFTGASYVDQAVRGSVNPFFNAYDFAANAVTNTVNTASFSALVQGLLIEPHMLASRERTVNLLRSPFFETELGGGFIANEDHTGWVGDAAVRGFTVSPFPISVYGTFQWEEPRDTVDLANGLEVDREARLIGGNGYLTATPSPDDRIVAFLNMAEADDSRNIFDIPDPTLLPPFVVPRDDLEDEHATSLISGVAWSHTFGYENIANAAFFFSDREVVETSRKLFSDIPFPDLVHFRSEQEETSYIGALNHVYGDGGLTWRYGIEGGAITSKAKVEYYDLIVPTPFRSTSSSDTAGVMKAYIDGLYEITPDLKVEGVLFARYIEDVNDDDIRLEPKLGVAWAPAEGHWLRAALQREGYNFGAATLAPVGIVGLQPNQFFIGTDGYADTLALRWDAEWNDWLFTAVDYQHQEIRNGSISVPFTVLFEPNELDFGKGRVDRVALTANLALGHGLGLSATVARTESDDLSTGSNGDLPLLPESSGQVALTYVSTANIKTTVAANYVGERTDGTTTLDDFWTLDAALQWEPFDKRFEVELAGFNLLDEEFELRDGLPGWGPTVKGTVKVRF